MMFRLAQQFPLLLLGWILASCSGLNQPVPGLSGLPGHLAVGQAAPDIIGTDTDGQPLKLSDQRGRVVLLSFWSST
jgi:cytochrome oxidase Cu insertion factor (SCO1/SenC/PrrC family)